MCSTERAPASRPSLCFLRAFTRRVEEAVRSVYSKLDSSPSSPVVAPAQPAQQAPQQDGKSEAGPAAAQEAEPAPVNSLLWAVGVLIDTVFARRADAKKHM